MKRIWIVLITLILLLSATSCGQKEEDVPAEESAPTWQEQYDLGIRYLSEGKYEEAILAFTAAIEIDAKQPLAFISRADAYIGSGETAENLSAALADYETAVGLDETNADAWLGMADVYIRQGDSDKAREVLEQALGKVGANTELEDKLAELEEAQYPLLASLPQLELTHFERSYDSGYDWEGSNDGAVGGVYCEAALTDSNLIKDLLWVAAYSNEPSPERIEEAILRELEDLKERGFRTGGPKYPWAGGVYPVWPEELGNTWYFLYVAVDENCEAVGYAMQTAVVE